MWDPKGLPDSSPSADHNYEQAGSIVINFVDTGSGLSKQQVHDLFVQGAQVSCTVVYIYGVMWL